MATIAPPPPRQRRPMPGDGGGRPPRPPRPPRSVAQARAQATALRRALLLMLATVLVPGSAQRFAGNRQLGKVALRVWLGVLVVLALVALVATQRPTFVVTLASSSSALTAVKVVMATLGAGWLFLVLDTWRLVASTEPVAARPARAHRGHGDRVHAGRRTDLDWHAPAGRAA